MKLVRNLALAVALVSLFATTAAAETPSGKFSGLIAMDAARALPPSAYVPVAYPGSGFHFGVFTNAKDWRRFESKLKHHKMPEVDWSRHMVVYAVLDAQTNALDFKGWSVNKKGRATFELVWDTIEPAYWYATPATLIVVDRARVKTITYTTGGSARATVSL